MLYETCSTDHPAGVRWELRCSCGNVLDPRVGTCPDARRSSVARVVDVVGLAGAADVLAPFVGGAR
jgi:hypothetical protein